MDLDNQCGILLTQDPSFDHRLRWSFPEPMFQLHTIQFKDVQISNCFINVNFIVCLNWDLNQIHILLLVCLRHGKIIWEVEGKRLGSIGKTMSAMC